MESLWNLNCTFFPAESLSICNSTLYRERKGEFEEIRNQRSPVTLLRIVFVEMYFFSRNWDNI